MDLIQKSTRLKIENQFKKYRDWKNASVERQRKASEFSPMVRSGNVNNLKSIHPFDTEKVKEINLPHFKIVDIIPSTEIKQLSSSLIDTSLSLEHNQFDHNINMIIDIAEKVNLSPSMNNIEKKLKKIREILKENNKSLIKLCEEFEEEISSFQNTQKNSKSKNELNSKQISDLEAKIVEVEKEKVI